MLPKIMKIVILLHTPYLQKQETTEYKHRLFFKHFSKKTYVPDKNIL